MFGQLIHCCSYVWLLKWQKLKITFNCEHTVCLAHAQYMLFRQTKFLSGVTWVSGSSIFLLFGSVLLLCCTHTTQFTFMSHQTKDKLQPYTWRRVITLSTPTLFFIIAVRSLLFVKEDGSSYTCEKVDVYCIRWMHCAKFQSVRPKVVDAASMAKNNSTFFVCLETLNKKSPRMDWTAHMNGFNRSYSLEAL